MIRIRRLAFPWPASREPIALALLCATLLGRAAAQSVDLAQYYPATLDWTESPRAFVWTTGPPDVWSLSSFSYDFADKLHIEFGPSQVVFGRHESNVLWAAVLPEEPGMLLSASAGEGESLSSLWLRFHPALVVDLFPPRTVLGPGRPESLVWAKRLAANKMNGSWQADNLPVVPLPHSIVMDLETTDGLRRFFMVDTQARTANYEPWFLNRALPALEPIDSAASLEAFDQVWNAFDSEYAMFTIKPAVDWNRLRDLYRPRAARVATTYELGAVLAQLLTPLADLHVWVKVGEESVPVFTRDRPLNANWNAVPNMMGGPNTYGFLRDTQQQIAWATTDDGIGYINVYGLTEARLPEFFDAVLEQLASTWTLIIDLRFNGGGDENLARAMAGRLIDRPRVYSWNQYRNGPDHADLGSRLARECEPRGPWRYEAPVLVLQGRRTMSSAESFALMLAACPQVTTLGSPTAGSSANPRQVETEVGITVNLPRWLDMDPAGNPIDMVGVAPDEMAEFTTDMYDDVFDPLLGFALDRVRAAPGRRRAGKASAPPAQDPRAARRIP